MSRSRTPLLNIPIEFEPPVEDIRVVVGIDFGTTFSGFSYAFIKPENEKTDIVVNDNWPGIKGPAKINTVLQYDEDYEDIITWGAKALAIEPSRRDRNNKQPPKPIELFKFHLGNVPEEEKPTLPDGMTPEKAITDYLHELGKVIQQEIKRCWPDIDFYRHVRIVVTVPAGFTEDTKTTMRKCLYDAGLIKRIGTLSLQFTTEPEASAIYCMSTLEEHGLTIGAKYLIVDCGGGTVDLTVRKLLSESRLREMTISTCGYYGGSYVDKNFLEFFESKVGKSAMDMLKKNHYSQVNYLVQQFCFQVKIPFTGDKAEFKTYELDIDRKCPAVKKYVTGTQRDELIVNDWIIDLDFETVKSFFDKVIESILTLIEQQLKKCTSCSVMFLVGGFSESKYFQSRVKQNFESQIKIAVPPRPVIAVVNGACEYGLNMKSISTRVLKWTYGVEIAPKWQASDPPDRKMSNGRIKKFSLMVKKGTEVNATDEYSQSFSPPEPDATTLKFTIYYTSKDDATYCDEPEMNLLGSFNINLPDAHLGMNRPVLLTLCFGSMEIVAAAKNQTTGEDYRTTFSSAEI
ncbi:hypothetical protein RhiirA1_446129 [Rhizophagus irregularis]|uniref:Actin-like ATPase domain-containing protein n=1 Tax=Rhizophagus irregularis TaxID=588596 RepID=A0A2N0R2R9_9GLOM|nr:hypothetical protein RhiirA1_446129 [Rhizophagus irregularis]